MSSDRTNSSVEKPWQLKGGLPLKKTRLWDPLFEMQPAYQKQVPVEVLWFEGYGVETSRGPESPGPLSHLPTVTALGDCLQTHGLQKHSKNIA